MGAAADVDLRQVYGAMDPVSCSFGYLNGARGRPSMSSRAMGKRPSGMQSHPQNGYLKIIKNCFGEGLRCATVVDDPHFVRHMSEYVAFKSDIGTKKVPVRAWWCKF